MNCKGEYQEKCLQKKSPQESKEAWHYGNIGSKNLEVCQSLKS